MSSYFFCSSLGRGRSEVRYVSCSVALVQFAHLVRRQEWRRDNEGLVARLNELHFSELALLEFRPRSSSKMTQPMVSMGALSLYSKLNICSGCYSPRLWHAGVPLVDSVRQFLCHYRPKD